MSHSYYFWSMSIWKTFKYVKRDYQLIRNLSNHYAVDSNIVINALSIPGRSVFQIEPKIISDWLRSECKKTFYKEVLAEIYNFFIGDLDRKYPEAKLPLPLPNSLKNLQEKVMKAKEIKSEIVKHRTGLLEKVLSNPSHRFVFPTYKDSLDYYNSLNPSLFQSLQADKKLDATDIGLLIQAWYEDATIVSLDAKIIEKALKHKLKFWGIHTFPTEFKGKW